MVVVAGLAFPLPSSLYPLMQELGGYPHVP